MWRTVLTFAAHRFLLLVVALVVINANFSSLPNGPKIQPASELMGRFRDRVAQGSEVVALKELMQTPMQHVFTATYNPFLWIGRWLAGLTHMSPVMALVLLSNLFFFLFLWESLSLFNRMVTPDVAVSATVLIILWPTSYELSLGSTLAMSCFLLTSVIRHSLDNQWLFGGLALGVLALVEPLAVGVLPLVLYLFWYFQRHFPLGDVVRRLVIFLAPFALAVFLRHSTYEHVGRAIHGSALVSLLSIFRGHGIGWIFSHEFAGQTISLLFFAIGAVAALLSNITFVHRLIPVTLLLLMALFTPYAALASRALLASACLEGIASASSPPAARVITTMMLALGMYEIFAVFH